MNRQSANEKEKIDRHIVLDIDSEENFELFERLGKALSSRVRIRMLALLKHKSMNIVELAQELTIPVSSAAFHVNMLEEANLINTEMLPGVRGSQKSMQFQGRGCVSVYQHFPPGKGAAVIQRGYAHWELLRFQDSSDLRNGKRGNLH